MVSTPGVVHGGVAVLVAGVGLAPGVLQEQLHYPGVAAPTRPHQGRRAPGAVPGEQGLQGHGELNVVPQCSPTRIPAVHIYIRVLEKKLHYEYVASLRRQVQGRPTVLPLDIHLSKS